MMTLSILLQCELAWTEDPNKINRTIPDNVTDCLAIGCFLHRSGILYRFNDTPTCMLGKSTH